ncbi:MAG: hypothetical protein HQL33_09340 [Alphaproteobacteria bacterium]|nr:hypothetical protein [Alphaproteobacteria bacterium]MBF0130184.1 hypothetical protein [Alphaproteobacteria bacterium]
MSAVFAKMFLAYGLTIIVSMAVAVLIKAMTAVLGKLEGAEGAASVAPVVARPSSAVDQTQGEIAAIAAAVYAVLGGSVRIVRIEPAGNGGGWAASGRLMHHVSHAVHRRSPPRHV